MGNYLFKVGSENAIRTLFFLFFFSDKNEVKYEAFFSKYTDLY